MFKKTNIKSFILLADTGNFTKGFKMDYNADLTKIEVFLL